MQLFQIVLDITNQINVLVRGGVGGGYNRVAMVGCCQVLKSASDWQHLNTGALQQQSNDWHAILLDRCTHYWTDHHKPSEHWSASLSGNIQWYQRVILNNYNYHWIVFFILKLILLLLSGALLKQTMLHSGLTKTDKDIQIMLSLLLMDSKLLFFSKFFRPIVFFF